jgi:hypothetical protein
MFLGETMLFQDMGIEQLQQKHVTLLSTQILAYKYQIFNFIQKILTMLIQRN